MRRIIMIIVACILLSGCGSKQQNISTHKEDTTDGIIVDVRTKEEYQEGHVVGAINIPYDEIDENVNLDKTKTIYVYCKSGRRSAVAYQTLKDLGYTVEDLGAYSSITLDKE